MFERRTKHITSKLQVSKVNSLKNPVLFLNKAATCSLVKQPCSLLAVGFPVNAPSDVADGCADLDVPDDLLMKS